MPSVTTLTARIYVLARKVTMGTGYFASVSKLRTMHLLGERRCFGLGRGKERRSGEGCNLLLGKVVPLRDPLLLKTFSGKY